VLKIIGDFEARLKKYPLMPMETLDRLRAAQLS
jgi:hypothetical protein